MDICASHQRQEAQMARATDETQARLQAGES